MQRPVMSHQRLVRELLFEIDGTTPVITTGGSAGTLDDNGAGDYTVTFTDLVKGQRAIAAFVTSKTDGLYGTASISGTAVTVKLFDDAGAATDGTFYLMAVLSDDPDDR